MVLINPHRARCRHPENDTKRIVSVLILHNVGGTPSCANLRAVNISTGPPNYERGPGGRKNIVSSALMEAIGAGRMKEYTELLQIELLL